MSRLARPASRLAIGSSRAGRRLAVRLAAWVARGRRADLTGWRAALGCWLRLAALAFGLYLLWRVVRALPALMWLLSAAWLAIAWRAGRDAPETAANTPAPAPLEDDPAAARIEPRALLIHWLDRLTRDRAGIHLAELHHTITRHPTSQRLSRAEMRAWLDRHHITVDRTLRVGAVAGRSGVSRATIEALLKEVSPLPETSPTDPLLHASDLHDSPVESASESGGEECVDPYFDDVIALFPTQ